MPSPTDHEIAGSLRDCVSGLVSSGADTEKINTIALAFFLDGTIPPAADFTPPEPEVEAEVEAPPPPPKKTTKKPAAKK